MLRVALVILASVLFGLGTSACGSSTGDAHLSAEVDRVLDALDASRGDADLSDVERTDNSQTLHCESTPEGRRFHEKQSMMFDTGVTQAEALHRVVELYRHGSAEMVQFRASHAEDRLLLIRDVDRHVSLRLRFDTTGGIAPGVVTYEPCGVDDVPMTEHGMTVREEPGTT